MEQLKNQETIAARINEKIEQREIDKVRDKETAGKINESLGEIADELFDSESFQIKAIEEPGYVWFGNVEDRTIYEESIAFPNYKEVISIIHLKDEF